MSGEFYFFRDSSHLQIMIMKTNIDMKEDLKHLYICPLTKKILNMNKSKC